eukprot:238760-Rhodomonas_salina.2
MRAAELSCLQPVRKLHAACARAPGEAVSVGAEQARGVREQVALYDARSLALLRTFPVIAANPGAPTSSLLSHTHDPHPPSSLVRAHSAGRLHVRCMQQLRAAWGGDEPEPLAVSQLPAGRVPQPPHRSHDQQRAPRDPESPAPRGDRPHQLSARAMRGGRRTHCLEIRGDAPT